MRGFFAAHEDVVRGLGLKFEFELAVKISMTVLHSSKRSDVLPIEPKKQRGVEQPF